MSETSKGFIAVHVGAGKYSNALKEKYKKISKEACEKGIQTLKLTNDVLEAAAAAVVVLEDCPLTNAAFGSNLTYEGKVECDASVMEGSTLQFGAVGAVSGVKNPIELAKRLCQYQSVDIGHGRVPPSFLVGPGALKWATEQGCTIVPPENLISVKAEKIYKHYKRKVENDNVEKDRILKKRMDTVGAICVDEFGNIASACSSGGIILKYPGRVGQAAIWGCGAWASKGSVSVASSTTGCGEHLVRTTLARTVAESITDTDCPTISLHNSLESDFINSRFLNGVGQKLGGAIAIRYSVDDDRGDFLWTHSTHSMITAYMNSNKKSARSHMSNLPGTEVGTKSVIEGMPFKLKK